jgi:hypothetical protein
LVNFQARDSQGELIESFDPEMIRSVLSADGARVTCIYPTLFPANARIDYQLAQCLANKGGAVLLLSTGPFGYFFTGSTTAPPVPALVLTNMAGSFDAGIRFQFATERGAHYEVQQNFNLRDATGWNSVLSSNAVGSSIDFLMPGPLTAPAAFYRVWRD